MRPCRDSSPWMMWRWAHSSRRERRHSSRWGHRIRSLLSSAFRRTSIWILWHRRQRRAGSVRPSWSLRSRTARSIRSSDRSSRRIVRLLHRRERLRSRRSLTIRTGCSCPGCSHASVSSAIPFRMPYSFLNAPFSSFSASPLSCLSGKTTRRLPAPSRLGKRLAATMSSRMVSMLRTSSWSRG